MTDARRALASPPQASPCVNPGQGRLTPAMSPPILRSQLLAVGIVVP